MRALAVAPLLLALAVPAGSPARAAEISYALQIPESEAAFEIPVTVEHPGTLGVAATWEGNRILSFRLEREGAAPVRRSGPSPQRLAAPAEGGQSWTLFIRALPASIPAAGTLVLTLPDPPEVVEQKRIEAAPPPPPPPEPPAWTVRRAAPDGADPRPYEAVESLRALLVATDAGDLHPDSCGWQAGALQDLAAWRDGERTPTAEEAKRLERLARAIRSVERMRTSADPVVAGPAPETGLRRQAWLSLRREELRPLLAELDGAVEATRGSGWPARLAGCLTACQRTFDARVADPRADAARSDVADAQWPAILAVGSALEALPAP